jgi:hypothetical protein
MHYQRSLAMRELILGRSLVAFALFGLTFLAGGCASGDGRTDASQKAVDSLRGTRQELARAKGEVHQANGALDKLAAGGNVAQSYQQYTRAVADVKAAGDRARARAQDMRARGREYVANWQKEIDQISSPELKAGAVSRRTAVKHSYDEIVASAQSAGDAYKPYLRNLQDIQRALASDLTPGGVDAAKPAMTKAKAEGETLEQRIDALIGQLDGVSGSMSSGGAPQAAR